jgi:Na+/proline symporter
VIQYLAIIVIAFVITPWVISAAGGLEVVGKGLGGASGDFGNLFNYEVFYTFGIVTTFVLIIGPLSDQMFYQRAMACPPENIVKTFVIGGLLFALVPLTLGLLGFVAAVPPVSETVQQEGFPTILNNVAAVRHYLPEWAVIGFIVMAICALSSTLDSALCAIGSIWGQDIYARYINPDADEAKSMMSNRMAVVVVGIVAMVVAILLRNDMNPPLIFNMTGIVSSPIVPAMILAVFWPRTTAQALSVATIIALVIGVPYGWWANHLFYVQGDQTAYDHVLAAQLITPTISLVIAWVMTQMSASAPEQTPAE